MQDRLLAVLPVSEYTEVDCQLFLSLNGSCRTGKLTGRFCNFLYYFKQFYTTAKRLIRFFLFPALVNASTQVPQRHKNGISHTTQCSDSEAMRGL